ncbi:MAG TPA: hypothetical protein VE082_08685, partial [Desulfobaccales bacterium]|nr:hypothetical protein [Desulfobaccales bacterium]
EAAADADGGVEGLACWSLAEGLASRGLVEVRGADMEREPRLPMDLPRPARPQASVWQSQALMDSSTKRIRNPLAQLFSNIVSSEPIAV